MLQFSSSLNIKNKKAPEQNVFHFNWSGKMFAGVRLSLVRCVCACVFISCPGLPKPVSASRLFQTVCPPPAGGFGERGCCLGFWPDSWWSSSDRLCETCSHTPSKAERLSLFVPADLGSKSSANLGPFFFTSVEILTFSIWRELIESLSCCSLQSELWSVADW